MSAFGGGKADFRLGSPLPPTPAPFHLKNYASSPVEVSSPPAARTARSGAANRLKTGMNLDAAGPVWPGPVRKCPRRQGPCYMPAAQIAAATAVKVSPMMNTAISNRVIGQMLRIPFPQLLDWVGPALARKY